MISVPKRTPAESLRIVDWLVHRMASSFDGSTIPLAAVTSDWRVSSRSRFMARPLDRGQHRGLGGIDVGVRMMTAVKVDRGFERAQLKLFLAGVEAELLDARTVGDAVVDRGLAVVGQRRARRGFEFESRSA